MLELRKPEPSSPLAIAAIVENLPIQPIHPDRHLERQALLLDHALQRQHLQLLGLRLYPGSLVHKYQHATDSSVKKTHWQPQQPVCYK